MVDIRLITLLPQVQQAVQPKGVNSQGAGNLTQFNTGSVLSGFIINRDNAGNPILRTASGDVPFASNFFLKIGSEVVIRILNTSGQNTAHIVTVNGTTPELAAQQSYAFAEPDVIIGHPEPQQQPAVTITNTQTAPPVTNTPVGSTINAIVVTPEIAQPTLNPGSALQLQVINYGEEQTPLTQAQLLATISAPVAAVVQTAANPALASLVPKSATVVFNEVDDTIPLEEKAQASLAPVIEQDVPETQVAKVTSSNLQAASAELDDSPLGQTVRAIVVPSEHPDEVLLKSPLGLLRASDGVKLPTGTEVNVRVTSVTVPNSYTVALANYASPLADLAPLPELATHWTSMQQITSILGEENMPIPSAASMASLGGKILYFMSTLKSSDFRQWLGSKNIASLEEKGYGALVRKAEGEFNAIAKQFAEPSPAGWNTLFFPIAVAGTIEQMRMFYKRERKKQNDNDDGEDARFVIEMNLSQLGEMQMDGFVKQASERLKFDLIVRTLQQLPGDIVNDLTQIYTNTGELTGYGGQIIFQAVREFPVHPMEEASGSHIDDVLA